MNTRFELLVIVIAGLFSLSSSFLVNIATNEAMVSKNKKTEHVIKTSGEKSIVGKVVVEASTPTPPITESGSSEIHFYDDGTFHFFHFSRIKRRKKCVQNWCLFAKLFLFLSHSAVLIMDFMHILSH